MASTDRLLPTGECWCGCGSDTAIGSFFLPGHDKTADSAVISVEYAWLWTRRQECQAGSC